MKKKKDFKVDNNGAGGNILPGFTEKIISLVYDLAEPLCESEGLECVYVEFQREPGGRILRLTIDKPGGAGLDDCVRISHQLGDLLDVYIQEDITYRLEVSTPGPERPLGRATDFERFKGNSVKIKTRRAIEGRKTFTGKLLGVTDGVVHLEQKDLTITISHKDILKARIVNNYGENECL